MKKRIYIPIIMCFINLEVVRKRVLARSRLHFLFVNVTFTINILINRTHFGD